MNRAFYPLFMVVAIGGVGAWRISHPQPRSERGVESPAIESRTRPYDPSKQDYVAELNRQRTEGAITQLVASYVA